MDNFIVTLVSNNKGFEKNEINDFTTILPQPIRLDNSWQVALTEVHYPKSFYSMDSGGAHILVATDDAEVKNMLQSSIVHELRNKPSSRKRRATRTTFIPSPDPEADAIHKSQNQPPQGTSETESQPIPRPDPQPESIPVPQQPSQPAPQPVQVSTQLTPQQTVESPSVSTLEAARTTNDARIVQLQTDLFNATKLYNEAKTNESNLKNLLSSMVPSSHFDVERRDLRDQIAALNTQLSSLDDERRRLQMEDTDLKTERVRLAAAISAAEEREKEAKSAENSARFRINKALAKQKEHEKQTRQLKKAEDDYNDMKAGLESQMTELDSQKVALNERKAALDLEEAEIKVREESAAQKEEELRDLENRRKLLAQDEADHKDKVDAHDRDLANLSRQIQKLNDDKQTHAEAVEKHETDKQQHLSRVEALDKLNQDLKDLQSQLETKQQNQEETQTRLDEMLKESHNTQLAHMSEINEKRNELNQREQDLKKLEKELKEIRAEITKLTASPSQGSGRATARDFASRKELQESETVSLNGIDDEGLYKYIFAVYLSDASGRSFNFEGGDFSTVGELSNALNEFYAKDQSVTKKLPIKFLDLKNHIQITPRYPHFDENLRMLAFPFFSNELRMSIGMPAYDSTEMIEFLKNHRRGRHVTPKYGPVDLKGGYSNMFIYTNIVQPHIVGDTRANVLRTIGIPKAEFGENISVEFSRLDFFDLGIHDFDTIRITFNFDDGTPVPFKFGRTVVQLMFKRK